MKAVRCDKAPSDKISTKLLKKVIFWEPDQRGLSENAIPLVRIESCKNLIDFIECVKLGSLAFLEIFQENSGKLLFRTSNAACP